MRYCTAFGRHSFHGIIFVEDLDQPLEIVALVTILVVTDLGVARSIYHWVI